MAVETLTAELVGKSSGYTAMMQGAIAQADSWGAAMQKAGLAAAAALAGGVGSSIGSFVGFDKAMVESTAIMGDMAGLTDETQKRMRDLAISLGMEGTKSAEEMARAYFYLASAGLNAEQSMAALPGMMKFAQAGAFDMALATDLATDAMSALGLTVLDDNAQLATNLQRVSDVIVRANTLANASTQQFAEALTKDAGTTMKVYNKSIEEGVAVLAAYADQGIKAALAGGMFGRMMRYMGQSAIKNAAAHEKYGVAVFDEAGNFRNLADIFADLEKAMGPVTAKKRMERLKEMGFQVLAQRAVLPLIGTSERIRGYQKALETTSSGFSEKVAGRQMAALSNQFKNLWNVVQVAGIELGQQFAPALSYVIAVVKDGVSWWRGLNTETKNYALIVAAAVSGLMAFGGLLAPFTPLILAAAAAVGLFVAYHGDLPTAFAALKAGAAEAWAYVRGRAAAFLEWVKPLWPSVATLASAAWSVMTAAVRAAVGAIGAALSAAASAASAVWSAVGGDAEINWGRVRDAVRDALLFATFTLENFGLVAASVWADFAYGVVKATNQAIYFFEVVLPASLQWFADNWRGVLVAAWNWLVEVFTNVGRFVVDAFNAIPWARLWDGLKSSARAASEWTLNKMKSVFVDNLDPLLKGALTFSGLWGDDAAEQAALEGAKVAKAIQDGARDVQMSDPLKLSPLLLPGREEGDLERRLREESARAYSALDDAWGAFWRKKTAGDPLKGTWFDIDTWGMKEVSWLDDEYWKPVKQKATDALVTPVEEAKKAAQGLNAVLFGSAEAQQRIEAYRAALAGAPEAGGRAKALDEALSDLEGGTRSDDVVDTLEDIRDILKQGGTPVNVLGADLL